MIINGERVATNPKTGAKVVFRGGNWVPYTPAAAPAQPGPSLGNKVAQGYSAVADPARDALARVIGNLDPRAAAQNVRPPGAPAPSPPGFAKTIAAGVVPPTLTGAGVNAGLMASGVGELGLLTRLALPAVGGALGALASGGSLASGAAQGALAGAGSTLIGGLAGIGGRGLLADKVREETTQKAGQALGRTLGKRIGVRPPPDPAALERVFKLGGASTRAGQIAAAVSGDAEKALAGRGLNLPQVSEAPMTLAEAEDTIESLNEGTYTPSGTQRSIQGRGAMIRTAHRLRDDIATQLDKAQPGVGTLWRQSRRDYGASKALQDLFQEPGVLENNQINQPRLVNLIKSKKYWNRLQSTLGPDDTRKLLASLRGQGPATDIPGKEVHVRMGMAMEPHLGLPRTPKFSGPVPAIMNRAATNPARIPAGIGLSGLLDWFNAPIEGETNASQ